jgi:hypothetical protein
MFNQENFGVVLSDPALEAFFGGFPTKQGLGRPLV